MSELNLARSSFKKYNTVDDSIKISIARSAARNVMRAVLFTVFADFMDSGGQYRPPGCGVLFRHDVESMPAHASLQIRHAYISHNH